MIIAQSLPAHGTSHVLAARCGSESYPPHRPSVSHTQLGVTPFINKNRPGDLVNERGGSPSPSLQPRYFYDLGPQATPLVCLGLLPSNTRSTRTTRYPDRGTPCVKSLALFDRGGPRIG